MRAWPLRLSFLSVSLLLLSACGQGPAAPAPRPAVATSADKGDFGAVSAPTPAPRKRVDLSETTNWPEAELTSGKALVSCDSDARAVGEEPEQGPRDNAGGAPAPMDGQGHALRDLEFFSLIDAMSPCQQAGRVRLRYSGRIAGDFTTLVERVSNMANRMGIRDRVLELDSSGGQVEDAIRAGDVIAETGWRLRVPAGAVCHSACVLILAAGDDREIAGAVGIHRIFRMQSGATSRAELAAELREVYGQLKDYLERNGAAVAVADLMMTVPNRGLRLLQPDELDRFGLAGPNAVQDDLERIQLARRCGEDFLRRRDQWQRDFERRCGAASAGLADAQAQACGAALLPRHGFPDRKCADDGPMAGLEIAADGQVARRD